MLNLIIAVQVYSCFASRNHDSKIFENFVTYSLMPDNFMKKRA